MYSPSGLVAAGIILPLLGVFAVSLRFYVRSQSKHSVGIDDWMILTACIMVCGMGAIQVIAAETGELGRDMLPVVTARARREAKFIYAVTIIEKFAYGCIKLSVCLFYRRIFSVSRRFLIVNNVVMALICCWAFAFFFAEVFLCGLHPGVLWSGNTTNQGCASQLLVLLWFAITDVLGDIAVLAMPYPCIVKLQMNKKEKLGISGVFLLGTLALAAGITRLGFVAQNFTEPSIFYNAEGQILNSPTTTAPFLFTIVELSAGIVAACLPTLAPLLRKTLGLSSMVASFRHTRMFNRTKQQTNYLPSYQGNSSSGKRSDCNILAVEEIHQASRATSGVSTRQEGLERSGDEIIC
ncbi:hypothetical protein JMJ35_009287 [Cladonia borealis]|uniref:Rhodopsin domain-containing protein n=1 Tax=Cladonia borealis TaxID=184061 RepID=A0AA39QS78_9LECA|nr:hypothetical protein JMJ35_009287 [Cladonia borealis]